MQKFILSLQNTTSKSAVVRGSPPVPDWVRYLTGYTCSSILRPGFTYTTSFTPRFHLPFLIKQLCCGSYQNSCCRFTPVCLQGNDTHEKNTGYCNYSTDRTKILETNKKQELVAGAPLTEYESSYYYMMNK